MAGRHPLAFCAQSTKDHSVAAAKKPPPTVMGRAPNTTAPDAATTGPAASALIDQRIADLGGWRGQVLAQVRQLIHEAAPGVVEEWKWRGTPVWSLGGTLCTGESWSLLTASQGIALERNRDEWMLRMRRMGSCPCKQPERSIARFRSNPSGSGFAGGLQRCGACG